MGMSRGDPLFWMHRVFTDKSKVNRYDQNGQLKQSMEFDNEGLELYNGPHKITEINNEDVVVQIYLVLLSWRILEEDTVSLTLGIHQDQECFQVAYVPMHCHVFWYVILDQNQYSW